MTDQPTLAAYDRAAKTFAEEWAAQPPPSDLQDVVRRHFIPGPTADIGCGSGRDTAWLNDAGWPAIGFDASDGLLAEARRRHPHLRFVRSALPALEGIADEGFANVLCETVIMHLPAEDLAPAVRRLLAILRPGGILYLSWRMTDGADRRDDHGRLYAAFEPERVLAALSGTELLLNEQRGSLSSGKLVQRIVARRAAASLA